MFIGAYLGLHGLLYVLLLLVIVWRYDQDEPFRYVKMWIISYSLRSFILGGLGLVAFTALSIWADIVPAFGNAGSYSLPQDYIAFGVGGWGILLIGLLGVLSPLIVAMLTWHKYQPTNKLT